MTHGPTAASTIDRRILAPPRNGLVMSTVERPRQRTRGIADTAGAAQPADVFVVFGITGDLAKQMTLHSLYRLEARGLLRCPIVGVAVDDWTVDDLRERARSAIVASVPEPVGPG